MKRYARLYAYFLRFSFSKAMEFRLDYCFRFIMDAVYYGVHLVFFGIIYLHTQDLGGWTYEQCMVFVASVFLVDALHMTIFATNMWWLPMHINDGALDYHLVRPVSSLFFVSVREFAANSMLNVLLAVGILVWALNAYTEPITVTQFLLYALLIINGVFLHYLIHVSFLIHVFWTHTGRGSGMLFYMVDDFMSRPDRIFKGWFRRVLLSAMPFILMVSYPTRALFAGLDVIKLVHIFVVTICAFFFVQWYWRQGLKAYSSASS